jgi:choline kinase
MKALILAAGVASRLRPLTDDTPKCLLEVAGKTILSRTIENLSANGMKEFIIVTGYLEDMIKKHLGENYKDMQFKYIHNHKYESTNNIYSLWLAKQDVKAQDFLLLDSDILFDKKIITLLINADYSNCLALRSSGEIGHEEIKVKVDSNNGSIVEISKEVKVEQTVGESIGIEKFDSEFSAHLFEILDDMIQNKNQVDIFYEAAFQKAINKGHTIYPVDVGNLFCMELDTVADFQIANNSSHLLRT